MPTRILREGILTSERVNELSPEGELFYRRLMSIVDDFGQHSANPTLLRSAAYPLKPDLYNEARITEFLRECEAAKLLQTYEVTGKRYLKMLDFRQRTRAMKSKCPSPDGHMSDIRAHPRSETETETETETNRGENSQMLITPERIENAQKALGTHRRRGDTPDEAITRKVLLQFDDIEAFEVWAASLGTVDPSQITGEGYGFYLADAQRWTQNGGRRPNHRKIAPANPPPPSTMDPETQRRVKTKYFDPKTITG